MPNPWTIWPSVTPVAAAAAAVRELIDDYCLLLGPGELMWHRHITCPVCQRVADHFFVWVSVSGGRFLTAFHEPNALPSRDDLESLPCRVFLMDLVVMDSILAVLVVSTGDGRTSVIRIDERNQQSPLMQRPLMQQVNAEPDENVIQQRPLMPAEQQQAADDEVNADLTPGIWTPFIQQRPLMPAEQQQAADDEVNVDSTPGIWTPF